MKKVVIPVPLPLGTPDTSQSGGNLGWRQVFGVVKIQLRITVTSSFPSWITSATHPPVGIHSMKVETQKGIVLHFKTGFGIESCRQ